VLGILNLYSTRALNCIVIINALKAVVFVRPEDALDFRPECILHGGEERFLFSFHVFIFILHAFGVHLVIRNHEFENYFIPKYQFRVSILKHHMELLHLILLPVRFDLKPNLDGSFLPWL
jgi:hypothetical protein